MPFFNNIFFTSKKIGRHHVILLNLKEMKEGKGTYTVSIKKDEKVMASFTLPEMSAIDLYKKLDSVKAVEEFLEKRACKPGDA